MRTLNKLLGLIAVGFVCGQFSVAGATGARKLPNVIFVLTDDMSWGELGMSGNTIIKTPHLDKLASQSLRFTNFNAAPTCAPTRAQLMSGKHEFSVGVTHTILDRENLRDDITLLPEILKRGGYQTGMFGKWHLSSPKHKTGLTGKPLAPYERGFDTAIYTYNQLSPRFDPKLSHNGVESIYSGYCGDVVFDEGMKWMDSCSDDQPFFAYLATSIPHVPLAAPQRLIDLYADAPLSGKEKTYYAMISAVDENMGRLMEWMKNRTDSRETILIFMTDNGHAISGPKGAGINLDGTLKENALYNAGFRGGKTQSWRGSTCVPFLIQWPGITQPNTENNTLASAMDILPTFAELSDVNIQDLNVQGMSLLPDIQGKPSRIPESRLLFTHVGRWKRSDELESSKFVYASVFNQRYRLVWGKDGQRALYDYANDRDESNDVSAEHPEVVQHLAREFDQWWEDVQQGMVNDLEQIRTGNIKHR
ncbi:arylsulfatase [Pontiellaceae bacterium B12227]|nr:arylsulfatase [Pontiellaceae bacterium B12227]